MNDSAWVVIENAPLQTRNTLHVAACAPRLLQLQQAEALPDALAALQPRSLLVLGEGSNVLFAADPPDLVMCLQNQYIEVINQDHHCIWLRAGAGVSWRELVWWSLYDGGCGLENLALIPGTVGAAPVQNIGAYGVQVAEFIHRVQVWDIQTQRWAWLNKKDCHFSYRHSVFKNEPGRYVITAVELQLWRYPQLRVDYPGINQQLQERGIAQPSALDVAQAISTIRRQKLPNPQQLGNAGSFFKNPQLLRSQVEVLLQHYPQLPVFPGDQPDYCKISAAWLIEQCGWKGQREGDAGIAANHALILVNYGHASGAQLLAFARKVAASVYKQFGVILEPEPHLVGACW